ncbi:MAG: DinB family protein [Pseudomonadota bacterium]
MDANLTFRSLAYNNAWANHRLLKACSRLSQDEFTAPRTGFFGSIRATLNHNLIIDRFYVDAMEGGDLGPSAWSDREPCATVPALHLEQRKVDERLITIVETTKPAEPRRIVEIHREDRVQREHLDRLLLHLFQHQIHHRGQAHSMMSGTSVAPPQLDEFFSGEEAQLREQDFSELGWTEAQVWRQ